MSGARFVLVGTSRSLLKVDIQTAEITAIDSRHGLYYGITWDTEQVYVAARWYPPLTVTARIERPRLLTFDANLTLLSREKFPTRAGGLHQILIHEGSLYCSCSREDRYLIRGTENDWSIWYPSPEAAHRDKDTHHFNSVWFDGDRMYLVGHNNGLSEIWELAYPERRLLAKHRIGHFAHNVWNEQGELAVCNSKGGTVETKSGRVLCEIQGFPRGAFIGERLNVIGVSDIANRRQRKKMTGRLNVYTKDWRLQRVIDLGRCGQVNEVRCLDAPDAAHNGLSSPVTL